MLWCFVPQMHGHFEGDLENHTSWCIHFSSSFEFVFTHHHPTWKQNNIAILSFPYQSCSTAIGGRIVSYQWRNSKKKKKPHFLKKKGESTHLYSHVERAFFSPPYLTGKVYSRKMSILLNWARKLFCLRTIKTSEKAVTAYSTILMLSFRHSDGFFSSVTFATMRTNLRTNVFLIFLPLSNSLH